MDETVAGDVLDRLADRPLHPKLVDRAHRPDAQAVLADELAFALVELTRADECEARALDGGRGPGAALEPGAAEPERGGEHHAVHVAGGRRLRTVEIAVRVDPEDTARPVSRREASERAERDGVVAAEHKRKLTVLAGAANDAGYALTRLHDRAEEASALIALVGCLGDRDRHVPEVDHLAPERREPLRKPGVADRRGAHVDASAPGTEVDRRTDDRDGLHKRRLTGSKAAPG